jgi:hypothetical protein
VRFASQAWIDAVVGSVNAHPDLPRALQGLGSDLAVVVEPDTALRRAIAAWGRHQGGRLVEWRVLEDEDEILEIQPAYDVRAPYRLWKQLLRGQLDPVKAALSGQVRVKGDLEGLVRRSSYRYILEGALRGVATEFPDEVKG